MRYLVFNYVVRDHKLFYLIG